MDLEAARKSLSKRSGFASRKVAFLAVAGLVLVVGVVLRAGPYFNQPAVEEKAPAAVEAPSPAPAAPPAVETTDSIPKPTPATQEAATAPSEPAAPTGDAALPTDAESAAVEPAEQPELPGAGMILVSKRPVEVLASPSPDASAMFGFPAGRPFRVIGREGGYARIQDLRSGASGWIDEAALAPPPPVVTAPSQAKPGAGGRKPATASADPKPKGSSPKAVNKKVTPAKPDAEVAAETDTAQPQKRPGLFGRGGLFGGIFSGGNQP
ncbi:MAG: hypothetical protein ACRECX_00415 [Methyloceanibacter sp.]|uniref:hypothetical protein n=1 Tax=Methyloceanibacter sp. TaxID=1965321 RepID=UPI003D6D4257